MIAIKLSVQSKETEIIDFLMEVINVIFEVYNDYFKSQLNLKRQLQDLSGEITIIIEDFLRFINKEKLVISVAPELLRIKR